jgi:hypothetical protein
MVASAFFGNTACDLQGTHLSQDMALAILCHITSFAAEIVVNIYIILSYNNTCIVFFAVRDLACFSSRGMEFFEKLHKRSPMVARGHHHQSTTALATSVSLCYYNWIPSQLDFPFYDFSMTYNDFSKIRPK